MASVKITTNGHNGHLEVDGTDLSSVCTAVKFAFSGNQPPVVEIELAAMSNNEIQMEEAGITLTGVKLPLSVELALYRYLLQKHDGISYQAVGLNAPRVFHGRRDL